MSLVREVYFNASTGESGERWVEIPGVLTAEEAAGRRMREEVLADMAALDARSLRPLREGDTARLADIEAQLVALRAELQTAL